ncbi:malto-oligosyltrehalose trehalohydrolase [Novipirellula caenicola]|uniref:Malto-oligosyltrehalose trehalohydrolase n=1 Tax=Novipirellula caenicola TaxID=1536901 RepID=A0ABP9VM94_9BACT
MKHSLSSQFESSLIDWANTAPHQTLGATLVGNNQTRFVVWAPERDQVEVELVEQDRRIKLQKNDDGYHVGLVEDCGPSTRYFYRCDGGPQRPDPVSRYQPLGVHGPSEVVDPAFDWTDSQWQSVKRDDLIIYEMHVGAFTPSGTFLSAIERLDELVELGVTAIELMPLADAAGRWNWGYDGVNWFAPNHNYGTPTDLKQLVDAAHQKGLAVIVDVVYNHLGPEGNYLGEFAPYFSAKHGTPWGDAPNFDDPQWGSEVRRYVIANAIYWLDEFHIDGLRVDAIHCTRDDSDPHIVAEMSEAVRRWSEAANRDALLIAESNVHDPEMNRPLAEGGIGFDAQWCDDFLHSVFAVVRPGEQLSNRVYRSGTDLAQSLSKGFVFEGTMRKARSRQTPDTRTETHGLVYSIQNHDFIGNHPLAKRLDQLTSPATQKSAAALLCLTPAIPMLFMGEEFASTRPFLFFVDFTDAELQQAVVNGRRLEYPQHDWSEGLLPTEEAAFRSSKLESRENGNQSMLQWYQSLIKLRKQWRASGLLSDANIQTHYDRESSLYQIRYARGPETATVYSRLTTNETDAGPITIEPTGELLLDSLPETSVEHVAVNELLLNQAKIFYSSGS